MTSPAPLPLRVAAVVAGLQGAATVVLGVADAVSTDSGRAMVGITAAAFFVLYGLLLLVGGAALWRPLRWARGPVLFAQLVWLPVAWSLREAGTLWLAVPLAVSAVVALVGLLNPASIAAIEAERDAGSAAGDE